MESAEAKSCHQDKLGYIQRPDWEDQIKDIYKE